jgi:hypothetical protein
LYFTLTKILIQYLFLLFLTPNKILKNYLNKKNLAINYDFYFYCHCIEKAAKPVK